MTDREDQYQKTQTGQDLPDIPSTKDMKDMSKMKHRIDGLHHFCMQKFRIDRFL